MARFDAYARAGKAGFLLDVQSDLLDALNTRVVVPLLPIDQAPTPAARLNPVLTISGENYVMATQFMASVPVRELGSVAVSLNAQSHEITAALDMLFVGF